MTTAPVLRASVENIEEVWTRPTKGPRRVRIHDTKQVCTWLASRRALLLTSSNLLAKPRHKHAYSTYLSPFIAAGSRLTSYFTEQPNQDCQYILLHHMRVMEEKNHKIHKIQNVPCRVCTVFCNTPALMCCQTICISWSLSHSAVADDGALYYSVIRAASIISARLAGYIG